MEIKKIKRDGIYLTGDVFVPETEEFDMVILMHGFTGCRRNEILECIKGKLQKANMGFVAFDFNGHGDSDGELKDMTVLNELGDGKAILDYVKTIKGVRSISILGHSQGGVVASMLAGYYPDVFKKVVLMAPAATLKDDALKGVCMDATYDPNHIPDELAVRGDIIGGFYFRVAQTLPIYEIAQLYKGPVQLIHGDNDTTVDCIAAKRYHDVYENSSLFLQKDADHRFSAPYTEEAATVAVDFLTK